MRRFTRRYGWVGLVGSVGLTVTAACSGPSKGSLVLAISTDMQAPKDIDVVSVFITTDSVVKFDYLGRVLPTGSIALPATLAIIEPDEPNASVRIRVTGFKGQNARMLRDVVTTVPHQQSALLRLPLNFLDDGSGQGMIPAELVPEGPDGTGGAPEGDTTFDPDTIASSCDFLDKQMTSINGTCEKAGVDSSTLPAYDPTLVYGDGALQANGAPSTCFDVPTCFAGAAPVTGLNMATCSFPLPTGGAAHDAGALTGGDSGATTGADASAPAVDASLQASDSGSDTCLPKTCASMGYSCGSAMDGCGEILQCGTCTAPQFCGGGGPSVCGGGGGSTSGGGVGPDAGLKGQDDPTALTGPGLNVALVTTTTGACNASGQCFVPLDNDATQGFTIVGNTVQMVAGVCARVQKGAQLYWAENSCPAKALSNPVCEVTTGGTGGDSGTGPVDASLDASNRSGGDGSALTDAGTPFDGSFSSPDAGPTCPVGWTSCSDGCFDTSTNQSNCGKCGVQCPAQMVCQESQCVQLGAPVDASASGGSAMTLASGLGSPSAIAVDGTRAYFTSGPAVMSVPLAGGGATPLFAAGIAPAAIAVDTTNLYWVDVGNSGSQNGAVMQLVLSGADAGQVITLASGQNTNGGGTAGGTAGFMTIDSQNVYWTDLGESGQDNGLVLSVPIGGGTVNTIASSQGNPQGLVVNGTNAFWGNNSAGGNDVEEATLAGGTPMSVASGANFNPFNLAIDATNVYWTNQSFGTVEKYPVGGGSVTTLASNPGLGLNWGIAVDSTTVYWTDSASGNVEAVPIIGGIVTTLVSGLESPRGIALDSSYVYWVTGTSGGSVMKTMKPAAP